MKIGKTKGMEIKLASDVRGFWEKNHKTRIMKEFKFKETAYVNENNQKK